MGLVCTPFIIMTPTLDLNPNVKDRENTLLSLSHYKMCR